MNITSVSYNYTFLRLLVPNIVMLTIRYPELQNTFTIDRDSFETSQSTLQILFYFKKTACWIRQQLYIIIINFV